VKLFSDGSLGARTAALNSPYADLPDATGLLLIERATLEELIRTAEAHAVPLAIHAIGDRAVGTVIAAFDRALDGRAGALNHRIEHLEMVSDRELEAMCRLGLTASMQPNFVGRWGLPGGMYEARLGSGRVRAMNPMKQVLSSGVRLALGSDAMPAGVVEGIRAAVQAPYSGQRLEPMEALRAVTREAAAAGGDADSGWIRPGNRADFAILDVDPEVAPVSEWSVSETMVGGISVWRAEVAATANVSGMPG
jgi:predicted amidohydrolase YtcJ